MMKYGTLFNKNNFFPHSPHSEHSRRGKNNTKTLIIITNTIDFWLCLQICLLVPSLPRDSYSKQVQNVLWIDGTSCYDYLICTIFDSLKYFEHRWYVHLNDLWKIGTWWWALLCRCVGEANWERMLLKVMVVKRQEEFDCSVGINRGRIVWKIKWRSAEMNWNNAWSGSMENVC